MTTTDQTVAKEILNQLGGNKFLAMTGSKNLLSDANSLRMTLTDNKLKAKFLKITLNFMDTYDMEFITIKKTLNKDLSFGSIRIYDETPVVIKTVEGVYDDMLQDIFTQETGLYTHL